MMIKASLTIMLIFITSSSLAQNSIHKAYSVGYFMDSCQDVLDNKPTFNAGFCMGSYIVSYDTQIKNIFAIDRDWCPDKELHFRGNSTPVYLGIIVKYIKNNPKLWGNFDIHPTIKNALYEAYPCKDIK